MNFVQREIARIRNYFYTFWDRQALRDAKKYADYLSEQNNNCKYVVITNLEGNYEAISKKLFDIYQRRGKLPKRLKNGKALNWHTINEYAHYIT